MVSHPSPVRVCIGTAPRFEHIESVIEYAIRANTHLEVEIHWLRAGEHGLTPTGCTGFSLYRYAIPQIFDSGFAIYLDVDMVVLGDIGELWSYRQADRWVCMMDGSTEVMVIDCTDRNNVPDIPQLMKLHKNQVRHGVCLTRGIPSEWNCEEHAPPGAKLIHFTDLTRQPWDVQRDDPAALIWEEYKVRQGNA